jgi:hypothetical protein
MNTVPTTYTAKREDEETAVVQFRRFLRTAVVIERHDGRWHCIVQGNAGIPLDHQFPVTDTWEESAENVARYTGDRVEFV